MTNPEFLNEFDIQYNNITSNQAPGLNNYEKSVFLTRAQESIIMEFYNGTSSGKTFESSEEVTTYLKSLVKDASITTYTSNEGLSEHSKLFTLPEDVWILTYEYVIFNTDSECLKNKRVIVNPITQDTYDNTINNPFKRFNNNRVLRLSVDGRNEIITDKELLSYNIRYISKPTPIILENLEDYGVSINGITDETPCQLHNILHPTILDKAVLLAKKAWITENQ